MVALPARRVIVLDFDQTLVALSGFVRWADAAARMREHYRLRGVAADVLVSAPRGCLSLFAHMARSDVRDEEGTIELQREVSQVLAGFEAEAIDRAPLLPGARELLEALPELRLRAAIVSSNDSAVIRAILEKHEIAELVAEVVGRDGVRHIKPSPEGMLCCCARLDVLPEQCLGVGDNAGDVVAASAAGMPAVGVTTGVSSAAELRRAGARRVLDHLDEVTALLREGRDPDSL